jgi:hypothetical protein
MIKFEYPEVSSTTYTDNNDVDFQKEHIRYKGKIAEKIFGKYHECLKGEYYPIIKIPLDLLNTFSKDIPKPPRPTEPAKPKRESDNDSEPIELKDVFSAISLLIVGISFLNSSDFLYNGGDNLEGGIHLSVGLLLMLGGIFVFYKASTKQPYKSPHELSYEDKLKKYHDTTYRQYLNEVAYYKIELDNLHKPTYIEEHRKKMISEYFRKRPLSFSLTERDIFQKNVRGVSEDKFFRQLSILLNDKISQDWGIAILHNSNVVYTPDIAIMDNDMGYCIDIEIDEPYVGNTKKPIHYSGNMQDMKRDGHFQNIGWIVIRFSEEQIVKYPDMCIKLIVEFISDITLGLAKLPSNQNITIPLVKRWSYLEAETMAKNNYRNTYS